MSGFDRSRSNASLANAAEDGVKMLIAQFNTREGEISSRLPTHITLADFKDAFISCVTRDKRLLMADPVSLFNALYKCAGAGLKPDGQEAVITMFGDDKEDADGNTVVSTARKTKQAVFMPMVWGLVKLIRNSGGVKTVTAELVFQGEHCRIVFGDEPHIEHERSLDPDFDYSYSKIIGAYCIISWLDGRIEREWMNRSELARVAEVNKAKKGPRALWRDQMDRKAPIRRLSKRLEKSPEMKLLHAAVDQDDTGETIEGEVEDVTQPPARLPTPAPPIVLKDPPAADRVPVGEREDPADAALGTRQPLPPVGGEAPKTTPPTTQKAAAPAFEAWALDEIGEPVDPNGEPITLAADFVSWLEGAMKKTTNPNGLMEHNGDGIADAGQDSALAQRVTAAFSAAVERLKPKETPASVPAGVADLVVVPLPQTPKGVPHWPNYISVVTPLIAALDSEAAVEEWRARNAATYAGSVATTAKIDALLAARRDQLQAAVASEQSAEPQDPMLAKDMKFEEQMKVDIMACATRGALDDLGSNGAIKAKLADLEARRPEMFGRLQAFAKAARDALPRPGAA